MPKVVKKVSDRTSQLFHAKRPIKPLGGPFSPSKTSNTKVMDYSKLSPLQIQGPSGPLLPKGFVKPPKVRF